MVDRVTRIGAILLVAFGLGSCQSSVARSSMGKGEQLLAKNRSTEAVEYFDHARALATNPLQKARALVGLGKAQLQLGQYRSAKSSLYDAKNELESSRRGNERLTAARRRQKESLETENKLLSHNIERYKNHCAELIQLLNTIKNEQQPMNPEVEAMLKKFAKVV